MAEFLVTNPSGEKYRVTAPEGATEDDVIAKVQEKSPGRQIFESAMRWATVGVDPLARAVASGVTGGRANKFAAGMDALLGKGSYEENLAAERQKDEDIPLGYRLPGEIAGGFMLGGPAGGAVRAALPRVAQAFTKLPKLVQAIFQGTGYGAFYGSGYADEESLEAAARGAGVGAIAGGVAQPLVKAVTGVGRMAGGLFRGRADPKKEAARLVAKELERDEMRVPKVAARLKDLGPQATIADAGGENVLGLARGVSGVPGPAKNRANIVLSGRGAGETARLEKKIDQLISPQDYFAAEEAFVQKLRTAAKPIYQKAYEKHPLVMSPRLDRMLRESRDIRAGIAQAAKIVERERAAGEAAYLGPVDKELTAMARYAAELGKMEAVRRPGVAKGFSLETWDTVKKGLDQIIQGDKYTNPLTGRLNQEGRSLSILADAIRKELDRATGGAKSLYAKARGQYAGDAELVNALRLGKDFMKSPPEIIRKELGKLSDAGKEAYRSGAARALKDTIESVRDQSSAAERLFGTEMARRKIRAVFPDDGKAYAEFARALTAEKQFAKTKGKILGGSPTQPRLAEQAGMERAMSRLGAILGSNVPTGNSLVIAGIGRQIGRRFATENPELKKELSRVLLSRNRAEQLQFLDRVKEMTRGAGYTDEMADLVSKSIMLGVTQEFGRNQ